MKKRLLALLILCTIVSSIFPTPAWAAEDTVGSWGNSGTWKFEASTGTLTLWGNEAIPDYSYSWDPTAPWASLRNSITSVVITEGITRVGNGAFGGDMVATSYENLKSISLPNTLKSIGTYAFGGSALTSVSLPSSLTSIGNAAFSGTAITSLYIPSSVSFIGDDGWFAFDSYTLEEITVAPNNRYFESENNILYDKGKTKILCYPYQNSTTSYVIPSTIQDTLYINDFSGRDALQSITIPANVTLTAREGGNPPDGLIVDETQSIVLYFQGDVPEITEDWYFIRGGALIKIDARKADGNENQGENITIFLNTATTITEGTPTVVSWNAASDAFRYYVNIIDKTTEIYYKTTVIIYDTHYSLSTPTLPVGTYEIYVQSVDTNGNFLSKSNTIILTVKEKIPPINEDNVFIKQSDLHTTKVKCTLASATMMLRRRAILDGISDWESITETAVQRVAWAAGGLGWSFEYRGMYVVTQSLKTAGYTTTAQKRNYFISMLQTHPEGIEIYNHSKPHAVLLTDYDESTDTFYCADPAGDSVGRITLAECTIPGNTQDQKIANINQIWYIKSNSNQKELVSSGFRTACPVDMSITIDNETLDSRTVAASAQNSYAEMTVSGAGTEKTVDVAITGNYAATKDVNVTLYGSDTGYMTFEVTHYFSDGTTETHTFKNVPLTSTSVGAASGFYPQSTVLLFMEDTSEETETVWASDPDETVTGPSTDFGELPPSKDDEGEHGKPSTGGHSTSSGSTSYTVNTSSVKNGTVTVSPKNASKGASVTVTVKPNAGYELDVLTVTDKDGNELKLTRKNDTQYTFTMPASKITVEAAFAKIAEVRRFTDISNGYWAEEEINWAAENGYINGNTTATFNPEGIVTRQQLWMILARLSGSHPADFSEAKVWAVKNGISDGTNPGNAVSRQQLVTILYRYAVLMGYHISGNADLTVFPDHASVADYAGDAMSWSVANSIVGGTVQGTLNPTGTATRAQFAVILFRFCKNAAA